MPYTVSWAGDDEFLRFPMRDDPGSVVEVLGEAQIVDTEEEAQALKVKVIDADPLRVVNVVKLVRAGNGWLVIHEFMEAPFVVFRTSCSDDAIEYLTQADYSADAFHSDEYLAWRFADFDQALRALEAAFPDQGQRYRFHLWGSVAPQGALFHRFA